MKKMRIATMALAATALLLTFTQCQNPTPATSTDGEAAIDGAACQGIKIAYVDIDTLLTHYDFWVSVNEEMISKEENVRANLNKKAADLQKDMEEFERKLNNNAFATRERAESEQNRILKKRDDLNALQERMASELAAENNQNSLIIRDSINNFLREYNATHHYNVILSRIGDNILYIDEDMNITQEIADGLNARYNATK